MVEILNSEVRKNWLVLLLGFFVGFLIFFMPLSTQAQQFDPLEAACTENSSAPACQESRQGQNPTQSPVTDTVNRVANLIAIATAVISVIVIIIAGITLVFSAGESSSVKSARDAIIYAAVGMVVVVLARSIVVFIVNRI